MRKNSSPTSLVVDAYAPSSSFSVLPAHLQRKIAMRWQRWIPWVRMHVLRCGYDAARMAAETARMRKQHSEHLLRLLDLGIAMRVVRRHRVDDPRLTSEARAVLMRAAIGRRNKAALARYPTLSNAEWWTPWPGNPATSESPRDLESFKIDFVARSASPAQGKRITIDAIQKRVSGHFHLRELRDQDLKARSNRQIIAFPRQVAMYIARQLTTASLPEIGRQFAGMHHTTVLYSIKKIEQVRRLDKSLNSTITQLMDALRQE